MSKQLEILKEQMESLEKRYNAAKDEYVEEKVKILRASLFNAADINMFNLCDRIHYLTCGYSHCDQCGYGYEEWKAETMLGRYTAKGQELERVSEYVEKHGAEKVLSVLTKLETIKEQYKWIRITSESFELELTKPTN